MYHNHKAPHCKEAENDRSFDKFDSEFRRVIAEVVRTNDLNKPILIYNLALEQFKAEDQKLIEIKLPIEDKIRFCIRYNLLQKVCVCNCDSKPGGREMLRQLYIGIGQFQSMLSAYRTFDKVASLWNLL